MLRSTRNDNNGVQLHPVAHRNHRVTLNIIVGMATDICVALGERIRKLHRAKNWRRIDLAEHSGVHEVHISDLERSSREPGRRTLSKIALALETTLSEMLKGL
ncbi:MAG: helix-turn-helix transcriptional regulator [Candidatus Korobacteraceae bacterium]